MKFAKDEKISLNMKGLPITTNEILSSRYSLLKKQREQLMKFHKVCLPFTLLYI